MWAQKSVLWIMGVVLVLSSCTMPTDHASHQRLFTDGAQRRVNLPDTVHKVVALRAGALRLLCYMDLADKAGYIEGNEQRRQTPYLFAHPGLRQLPVIGAGNNYDTELLAAADADLVLVTFMSATDADRLQDAIQKPVMVLDYGDLKEHRQHFYQSLYLLGELFYRTARADSLVRFVEENINELKKYPKSDTTLKVYIGGVAYRGAHGICSTEPGYPPFTFLGLDNVASSLGEVVSSPVASQDNAQVDPEQLILWDPDYIFLDAAGRPVWQEEVDKMFREPVMQAFAHDRVYTVMPYNWYTTNYENVLCNAWFIAATLYPEVVDTISLNQRYRDIYRFMLGADVFDAMNELYHPYEGVTDEGIVP